MTANGNNFFILYQKGDEGTCVINKIDLKKLEVAAREGLMSPNLGEESYRDKWSAGWSNIKFFNLNNKVYMFLNKVNEGDVHIEEFTAEGKPGKRVYDNKWSAGWSEIDIFYQNNKPILMHQKKSSGQTKFCGLKID